MVNSDLLLIRRLDTSPAYNNKCKAIEPHFILKMGFQAITGDTWECNATLLKACKILTESIWSTLFDLRITWNQIK